MNQLLVGFLLDRRASGATQKTLTWHESAVKKFLSWVFAQNPNCQDPTLWTSTTLRQYIVFLQSSTSRKGTPLSETSVTTYTSSMLAFVRWLFSEGYIDRDITERVKKPRPPQDQKAPFTPRDLHALLATAKQTTRGARDHALLCVMVDCGLRASEVCQLSVDDVMVPDRLVRVRQGKGRKDRIVPCSAETAKVVYRYLTRVRRQIDTDVPNLFLNARQKQMTANGLLQLVMRLGEAAQVENVHPHRFRHTFALSYLQNGGDPLTLQRLMGHTTLTMTNHYVSMATDDLQRVHQTASPLMNLLK